MGKVDARKLHRSSKVPITESAKSNDSGTNRRGHWKVPTCSTCKQRSHRSYGCKMPPHTKRRVVSLGEFYLDLLTFADTTAIKPAKHRKQLDLLAIDNWI